MKSNLIGKNTLSRRNPVSIARLTLFSVLFLSLAAAGPGICQTIYPITDPNPMVIEGENEVADLRDKIFTGRYETDIHKSSLRRSYFDANRNVIDHKELEQIGFDVPNQGKSGVRNRVQPGLTSPRPPTLRPIARPGVRRPGMFRPLKASVIPQNLQSPPPSFSNAPNKGLGGIWGLAKPRRQAVDIHKTTKTHYVGKANKRRAL